MISQKNHKFVNEKWKGVKSEKIKVKTLFCDKDLSSVSLLNKRYEFIENDKFVNKEWKGVISGKRFPLVCSKYLSSWTGLGSSVNFPSTFRKTFGQISDVSGPKMLF